MYNISSMTRPAARDNVSPDLALKPVRNRRCKYGAAKILAGIALVIPALLACAPMQEAPGEGQLAAQVELTEEAFPTLEPATALPTASRAGVATPLPTVKLSRAATMLPPVTPLPVAPEGAVFEVGTAEADEARDRFERLLRASWDTDFTRATISFGEIMTGGPPKDGIPAIDNPVFETVTDAGAWLEDLEPVQVVDLNGDVRAYPVQVMVWHELVNDTVGGEPVVITF